MGAGIKQVLVKSVDIEGGDVTSPDFAAPDRALMMSAWHHDLPANS